MSAIKGDETNAIETIPLQSDADKSEKPLVDSGKQIVKASGKSK